jgi:hypothetical protein
MVTDNDILFQKIKPQSLMLIFNALRVIKMKQLFVFDTTTVLL